MELEQGAVSMVKGCFLYNAGALEESQKKKKKHSTSNNFIRLPLESDEDTDYRHRAFVSCWSILKEKLDDVITKQHDKVFSNLLGFVLSSTGHLSQLHLASITTETFRPPRLEIPTAVLIAGVNMPDHDVLFQQLRNMIRKVVSPHVVLLKASSCTSGMKAAMKEILLQLWKGDQKLDQSCSDSDEAPPTQPHPSLRIPLCTMDVLCEWYQTSCDNHMTNRKECTLTPVERPPVVIIIEDFESFSSQVLQDLIASFSPHLPQFPVVMLLGVATSIRVVHSSLSRAASSLLCLEVFHTQHSALSLQQILNEILICVSPFKLGPKALQFLLQQFFYCNFSLVNFTTSLKFAVMEHFYWQPLSVLSSWQREGSRGITLNHAICEAVRATPSFQTYVEGQSPLQQVQLLENDKKLESVVHVLLNKLHSYHVTFFPLLECLHILTKHLPDSPLGSKKYELYLNSLERNITEHPKFHNAWSLVNLSNKEDLMEHLRECVYHLKSYHENVQEIAKYLKQFSSVLEQLASLQEHQPMETDDPMTPLPAAETTSERKMRFHERLRQIKRKKEPTSFELLRATILESILVSFKETLVCPSSLTLHEVMYFNNVSSMKKQLAPAPRASLQTALSTPHYYLPSAGHVTTEASALDRNMPDVCVAYQLHLECGRLINLYDWLQAFVAIVSPTVIANDPTSKSKKNGSKEEKKKGFLSKQEEVDPLLHARFIQSVSELQFLGFIKPTQRKTDHVQRLTWGAC